MYGYSFESGWGWSSRSEMATPLRDPARTFTPLGRPHRKPRKVAPSLTSIDSSSHVDEYYFLERPHTNSNRHMSLRECSESRPPLQSNVVGPTPCTYTLPQSNLRTVGGKINPRTKYPRGALPSANHEVWTLNVATLDKSPSPCAYSAVNGIGGKCPTKKAVPSYSMSGKRTAPNSKTKNSTYPAPNSYNTAPALDYVMRNFSSFTMSPYRNSKQTVATPGPAQYYPKYTICQHRYPSYTIRTRTATV